jgi:hypothetical protein
MKLCNHCWCCHEFQFRSICKKPNILWQWVLNVLHFVVFLYCQAQVYMLDLHEHITITSSLHKIQFTLIGLATFHNMESRGPFMYFILGMNYEKCSWNSRGHSEDHMHDYVENRLCMKCSRVQTPLKNLWVKILMYFRSKLFSTKVPWVLCQGKLHSQEIMAWALGSHLSPITP